MNAIYTVGGTVDSQQRAYVKRAADAELLQRCKSGEFTYILSSRQVGKSSVMLHTVHRLREQGSHAAVLDLTRIGTDTVTEEQWYLELIEDLGEQLNLDNDPLEFWEQHAHLGFSHRFIRYVEHVILAELSGQITIFVDEIDATLSLKFRTDDFFAAIRHLYNARGQNTALYRLGFVLIGVATPNDLIADPNRTPFNIGGPLNLSDFTFAEAAPLQQGLPSATAQALLQRVLYWTDGHPYLTQRLCAALAAEVQQAAPDTASPMAQVDALVTQLFFDERAAQDSNLDFVKNMLSERLPQGVNAEDLMSVYRRLLRRPEPDDAQSAIKNHLKLSGVVKRQGEQLVVRNRLYRRAFSNAWARTNLPIIELRRELRTVRLLLATFVLIALALGALTFYANQQRLAAVRAKADTEKAQVQAQSSYLSAGALLAAYAPNAYSGYADRAGLLAQQALLIQGSRDNVSNLLRTLQGVGTLSHTLQGHSAAVWSVAFSPDGKRVVSGSADNTVRLWEAETGQPLGQPWQGHSAAVTSVAFSPDGKRVVSGSADSTVRLWEIETGQPLGQPWQGHSATVTSVAFSPDGKRVVSGSADKTVRLWEIETGQPLGQPWQGHSATVTSVAFSPDGKRVVSGSADKTVRLWEIETGQPLGQPWQGHSATVTSVAFSPDGKRVVSGSADKTVRLWEIETGQPLGQPWQGHSATVTSVAFSPDGKRVVSGSWDNTVRLWDVETGQPLGQPWQGHSDTVWSVAFSPDGKRVVSGGADNPNSRWDYMILIWNVDESEWQRRACRIAGRNFTWDEWRRYMGNQPYVRTCSRQSLNDPNAPDYPVHPTVIDAWLDEAAHSFNAKDGHTALQHYQDALTAAENTPVKDDMIALFLAKCQTLDPGNPLIPRMRQQIDTWVTQQPETNRRSWQERLATLDHN